MDGAATMRDERWPHGVCAMIEHLPHKELHKCVARYRGDHYANTFSCWDQYLAMAFAQLTYRESLRDIRDLPARGGRQAVPHGLPHQRGALDAGRCERIARLAHLCRLRADADCNCAPVVRPRPDERRSGPEPVCTGFDDHRSVPWHCSPGPGSGVARRRSRCTRCWTCAAIFQRSCTSPTARCTALIDVGASAKR